MTGCWSSVGKIGGRQELNLQSPGCLTKIGTPMHELMHALGFMHEQNRWERDNHVTIMWQNIQRGKYRYSFSSTKNNILLVKLFSGILHSISGKDNNFKKASKDSTSGYGVPYDFRSVMHYSQNAFSQNGQPTILPKVSHLLRWYSSFSSTLFNFPSNWNYFQEDGVKMGQRENFSRGDIQKLRRMYNCPDRNNSAGGGFLSMIFG